jgi:hypothetical protein
MPGAFPVLVVHDEVVIECNEEQVEAAGAWRKTAMIDGMAPLISPVPVAIDVKVGQTWGGSAISTRRVDTPRLQRPLRSGGQLTVALQMPHKAVIGTVAVAGLSSPRARPASSSSFLIVIR